jgi:hypothetical protein
VAGSRWCCRSRARNWPGSTPDASIPSPAKGYLSSAVRRALGSCNPGVTMLAALILLLAVAIRPRPLSPRSSPAPHSCALTAEVRRGAGGSINSVRWASGAGRRGKGRCTPRYRSPPRSGSARSRLACCIPVASPPTERPTAGETN